MDTTDQTVSMYWNGSVISSFTTNNAPTLNADLAINNTLAHRLGAKDVGGGVTEYFNGLMALPILVDGAALDPTSFGELDDDGYWNPIDFTGATTTTDNVSVGGTATAETTFLTYVPANAFDGNTSTRWISSATPAWLEYDRGSGNGVISTSYSISCGPSGTASTADMPKNWTIEGYNGSSWDTLATVTGEAAWSLGETRLYTFTNTTSYEKYRIDVTLQQGGGAEIEIGELTFYASGTGFGTNGFELDYADTAAFGADVKTNTNTMTPTFEASYSITSDVTTYTFASADLGTPDADRYIVVGTGGPRSSAGARTVSSMTINGVSATFAGRQHTINNNGNEIWYAPVPTGATGDIVVTWNTSMHNCGIAVWSVLNLGPIQDVQGDGTNTTAALSISIGGGEGAVSFCHQVDSGNATAATWTTATERSDDVSESVYSYTSADYTFSAASNGTTITVDNDGGSDCSLLGVTFGRPNDNFYKTNNFTAADQLADTPTDSADDEIGNFATLNPLLPTTLGTLSDGNRTWARSGNHAIQRSNFAIPSTGKWAFVAEAITAGNAHFAGVVRASSSLAANISVDAAGIGSNSNATTNAIRRYGVAVDNNPATWSAIGGQCLVVCDVENDTVWFAQESGGSWVFADGDPSTDTGGHAMSLTSNTGDYFFAVSVENQTVKALFDDAEWNAPLPSNVNLLATQEPSSANDC
jgi:hypothetical protein